MTVTGVLITGYGGPDCLDSVGPFMCNLMRREPSPELTARVQRKYLAIGGSSPQVEIAVGIAEKLAEGLAKAERPVPIAVGMRYWEPLIDDALQLLQDAGCDDVIAVPLSAFEAQITTASYRSEIAEAAARRGMSVREAPLLSDLPEFAEFFAASTASSLIDMADSKGMILAFTAHSLPLSDLSEDDPYVNGLERVAEDVAVRLGLESGLPDAGEQVFGAFRAFGSDGPQRAWYLVYQSKGERPGEWLGPDLDSLIDACIADGVPGIICVPIGFATDHMETLYDLDIVANDRALSGDVEFERVAVPNDYDTFVEGITKAVVGMLD